jgi:hypothetical protein
MADSLTPPRYVRCLKAVLANSAAAEAKQVDISYYVVQK